MKEKSLLSKLNWRQILIHFLAFWFFIYAFKMLSYLYDTRLVDIARQSDSRDLNQELIDNNISSAQFVNFTIWTETSSFIGLLTAFVISLAISTRKNWHWLNTVIAFIIGNVLLRFNLLGWTFLQRSLWRTGRVFGDMKTEFLVNGILLLTIGLLIFFSKRSSGFIEKGLRSTG
jgi:hypothetical protein